MTECKQLEMVLPRVKGRELKVDFAGGNVSSDGGLLALKALDRKLGLSRKVAGCLRDRRDPSRIEHSLLSLVRQRLFGICAGWEDLNDADHLRHDVLHQSVCGVDGELGSAPTLCRLENQQDHGAAVALHRLLMDQFLDSFEREPEELVLDFDATDDPVHGHQEGRFFHGYYDRYCFLPLYVFCGSQLLVAYLRPGNSGAGRHAAAILKLLVKAIRARFASCRIVVRADSGFCRDLLLSWCDRHDIGYVIGIARNKVLEEEGEALQQQAAAAYAQTGEAQRLFGGFEYKAGPWKWLRYVVHKAEHLPGGANPRFVVTNLVCPEQELYEQRYCARGEMENRIKEQMQLFSDRTSAHAWWPNQWRLLLSGLAYVLLETLRRSALKSTSLARAQMAMIRLKLIKIGAVVTRNTRTIRVHLSSAYPLQELFAAMLKRLQCS